MKFNTPIFVKEFTNHLSGKYNLMLYYSKETHGYRWHFGYPEELVKPLIPLLEATCFWGEQHWTEIDGYCLYWLPIVTEIFELNEDLLKHLRREDQSLMSLYNQCFEYLKRQIL